MKFSLNENGILLSNSKTSIFWCLNSDACLTKFPDSVRAIINPFTTDCTEVGNNTFHICGAGEWEFGEILIEGYKGEKEFYYVLNADKCITLLVSNPKDIDDAFKQLSSDIDNFIINLVNPSTDLDILKKEIDAIESGNVAITGKSVFDNSFLSVLPEVLKVSEIVEKKDFTCEGNVSDKKFIFILR